MALCPILLDSLGPQSSSLDNQHSLLSPGMDVNMNVVQ